MYCPNCGKANSSEQKFCRACGLNLEDSARSVVEQLPAVEQDQRLVKRKRLVENLLLTIGGVGITAFVLLIIGTIISEIIIGKGNVVGGIVFMAFILAMGFALMLVLYRQSLIEATTKRPLPASDNGLAEGETPLPEASTRQLADPYFEPVPSVTEPTTDLLAESPKKRSHDA